LFGGRNFASLCPKYPQGTLLFTRFTVLVVQYPSSNQARVAVAYDSVVAEKEVNADIQRLAQATRGQVLDVKHSLEPNRRGGAKTTATDFTLTNVAPLFNGEPQILPYLVGFQNRKRLEVVFSTGSHFTADSFAVADTPQIVVRRYTDAQGGIRYEAEVKDANAPLAPIVFTAPVPSDGTQKSVPKPPTNSPKQGRVPVWMFILLGLMGLIVIVVAVMRNPKSVA